MMSFERSIACGVTAFETDVQVRYVTFSEPRGAFPQSRSTNRVYRSVGASV